jgi:hypothetical protein
MDVFKFLQDEGQAETLSKKLQSVMLFLEEYIKGARLLRAS